MKVDQAAYRVWGGDLRPGARSVLAIASTEIRRVLARSWIRRILGVIVLINVVMAAGISFMVYRPVMGGMTLGDFAEQRGFGHIDPFVIALRGFLGQIWFFTPVVVALTAGPLISEDRRAHALPLYFSRPIRHWHYLAGKFAAGLFFPLVLTIVPPIAMFAVEIANSPEEGILLDRLALLGRACMPCFALSVLLTSVGLAVSSLVERTNTATLAIFGVFVIVAGMAPITARFIIKDPEWNALNPFIAIQAIAHDLLPTVRAELLEFGGLSRRAKVVSLDAAWLSVAAWTVGGFALLFARIRKVEVVT